jgi:hypothetical protein
MSHIFLVIRVTFDAFFANLNPELIRTLDVTTMVFFMAPVLNWTRILIVKLHTAIKQKKEMNYVGTWLLLSRLHKRKDIVVTAWLIPLVLLVGVIALDIVF